MAGCGGHLGLRRDRACGALAECSHAGNGSAEEFPDKRCKHGCPLRNAAVLMKKANPDPRYNTGSASSADGSWFHSGPKPACCARVWRVYGFPAEPPGRRGSAADRQDAVHRMPGTTHVGTRIRGCSQSPSRERLSLCGRAPSSSMSALGILCVCASEPMQAPFLCRI